MALIFDAIIIGILAWMLLGCSTQRMTEYMVRELGPIQWHTTMNLPANTQPGAIFTYQGKEYQALMPVQK